jgi:hypothetical protein
VEVGTVLQAVDGLNVGLLLLDAVLEVDEILLCGLVIIFDLRADVGAGSLVGLHLAGALIYLVEGFAEVAEMVEVYEGLLDASDCLIEFGGSELSEGAAPGGSGSAVDVEYVDTGLVVDAGLLGIDR